jgi:hypothetical protein
VAGLSPGCFCGRRLALRIDKNEGIGAAAPLSFCLKPDTQLFKIGK